MKLQGKISILVSPEGTTIEVNDPEASVMFLRVKLTPEQLSAALSRQMYIPCDIEVVHLDKIGKKHECDHFLFEIPKDLRSSNCVDKLHDIVTPLLKDGWVADKYYGSQNSFHSKDGKEYANAIIRRWV